MAHYVFVSDGTGRVYKFDAAAVPGPDLVADHVWQSEPIASSTRVVVIRDLNFNPSYDGVYVGGQLGEQGCIYQLSLDTGEILGQHVVGFTGTLRDLIYDDGIMYYTNGKYIGAYNIVSPSKNWSHLVGTGVVGRPVAGFGKVYCASEGGKLYAFHPDDGTLAWPSPFDASQPIYDAYAGVEAPATYDFNLDAGPLLPNQIYAFTPIAIFIVDTATGTKIAHTITVTITQYPAAVLGPVRLHGLAPYNGDLIASDYDSVPRYQILGAPRQTWRTPVAAEYSHWLSAPTVALNPDEIFVSNDGVSGPCYLHALTPDGTVQWHSDVKIGDSGDSVSMPAVDSQGIASSDNVFVTSSDGHIYAFNRKILDGNG
jgi:outer membrane protein assembly factor BamB